MVTAMLGWMRRLPFHAVAALAIAAQANAQEPVRLPLAGDNFIERFDGKSPVRVSGNLIAGVRLGGGDGAFRPEAMRIVLTERPSSGHLCLGVFSRDGRYAAENLYRVERPVHGQATFAFPPENLKPAAQYPADSIAVLVRDTRDCASAEFGEILPSVATTGQRDELQVLVNGVPERTEMSLMLADGARLKGECRPGADRAAPSLAFATVCTVKVPQNIAGVHTVEIGIRERFTTVPRTVRVRLDRP